MTRSVCFRDLRVGREPERKLRVWPSGCFVSLVRDGGDLDGDEKSKWEKTDLQILNSFKKLIHEIAHCKKNVKHRKKMVKHRKV